MDETDIDFMFLLNLFHFIEFLDKDGEEAALGVGERLAGQLPRCLPGPGRPRPRHARQAALGQGSIFTHR